MSHGYQTSDARKRAEEAGPLDHYVYELNGQLVVGSFCACGSHKVFLTGTGRLRCADCQRVIRGPAA